MAKRTGRATRTLGVAALALLGPAAALANYPIFSQRYTADPVPLVEGGRVYVLASHDLDGQTWWDMKDFTCVSSDDLVNWTDHGEVFDAPRDTTWARYAWAPALIERGGTYYLYYTNARDGTGVAVASSIFGPYRDPIGRPLVVTGGFSDPSVLVDDDGTAYLHVRDAQWAKLGADLISLDLPVQGVPRSSFPDYKEGEFAFKWNGRYNYSYSTVALPSYGTTYAQSVSDQPTSDYASRGRWFWLSADNQLNTHGAPSTGGVERFGEVRCPVARASGVHDLYLRFAGVAGTELRVDWWRFDGGAVSGKSPPPVVEKTICLRPLALPGAPDAVYLLLDNQDGTWSFQALPDRRFLALADPASGKLALQAARDASAAFVVVSNPDASVSLRAANGKFVIVMGGELAATFEEELSGCPRALPGSMALFALDACRSATSLDCDLDGVEARPGTGAGSSALEPPRAVVFGDPCLGVDATLREGRVALERAATAPGAAFDRARAGAGDALLTYYQRGCGCDAALRLVRDLAADTLVHW